VEAPLGRDDLEPAGGVAVGAGELDGGLVGLGPAVAEEALAAERTLRERLGERPLRLDVPGVRHVDQLADLLADRLDDARGAVADQIAAPAGEEVEVAVPLGVPNPRALAPDQADREPPVVGDHIPVELGDRLRGTLMRDLLQDGSSRLGRVGRQMNSGA
jgi:hypothetical protein